MMASDQTPTAPEATRSKDGQDDRSKQRSVRERVAPFVAVALLVVFTMVLGLLFFRLNLPQQEWDRAMYLLNGVEAIAFAAVGYLFGKEVHRQRAEAAEDQIDEELARTRVAEQQAMKGQKLAGMVVGAATVKRRHDTLEGMGHDDLDSLQSLAVEARRLFPDEPYPGA